MKLRTHVSAGFLAFSFPFGLLETVSAVPMIAVGSLLPDIDLFSDHRRTFLHWYPAWILLSAAGFLFSKGLMIIGMSGLIHVFLDSFTKMGVPSLFRTRMIGLRKIRTGGDGDFLIFCGILFLIPAVHYLKGGLCFL